MVKRTKTARFARYEGGSKARIKKYHKTMSERGGVHKLPPEARDAITAWNRLGNDPEPSSPTGERVGRWIQEKTPRLQRTGEYISKERAAYKGRRTKKEKRWKETIDAKTEKLIEEEELLEAKRLKLEEKALIAEHKQRIRTAKGHGQQTKAAKQYYKPVTKPMKQRAKEQEQYSKTEYYDPTAPTAYTQNVYYQPPAPQARKSYKGVRYDALAPSAYGYGLSPRPRRRTKSRTKRSSKRRKRSTRRYNPLAPSGYGW